VAIIVTFVFMPKIKTILVAPLHWGLGHAARCIPLIEALLSKGFEVVIASDGAALVFLRKEFPQIKTLELPSYDIKYPENAKFFSWQLLLQLPHIRKAILVENKLVSKWMDEGKIDGIISDNRPGVRHDSIPSVYITHQLQVLSGRTTSMSSKMHQNIIKKFTACWVPDVAGQENLSGDMGHLKKNPFPVTYIGPLSRMQPKQVNSVFDILCVLSGPEPQRSLLEKKLLGELKDLNQKILLVQGLPSEEKKPHFIGCVKVVSFMNTQELEKAMNESTLIICRSGYTSIMDLAVLQKKVFFIPTPGQYEQEYLAKLLEKKGVAPYCSQQSFTTNQLDKISSYSGFDATQPPPNYDTLFGLFEGK